MTEETIRSALKDLFWTCMASARANKGTFDRDTHWSLIQSGLNGGAIQWMFYNYFQSENNAWEQQQTLATYAMADGFIRGMVDRFYAESLVFVEIKQAELALKAADKPSEPTRNAMIYQETSDREMISLPNPPLQYSVKPKVTKTKKNKTKTTESPIFPLPTNLTIKRKRGRPRKHEKQENAENGKNGSKIQKVQKIKREVEEVAIA